MPSEKQNLYQRAGIDDLAEFYRTKFVSDEVLDARYFKALDRFDMRFARTMWVYDNVKAGSDVLELGCGSGMLALLKRKGVSLTGIDLSDEGVAAARRNGYDATFRAELSHLPFAANSFDYVISLDVLGHVAAEDKDPVLAEVKRVLRPHGVTMHGIESTDRAVQKGYDEMTAEELRKFVEVDGHVGLEEEQEHAVRFQKYFQNVAWRPRYALCLSSEEFLKQADKYGLPFEDDFLDYLRSLSFKERRAFDMAMGYVFNKVSDLDVTLPKSGLYVLIKASDAPLGSFYNEHRDRRALFPSASGGNASSIVCLDRHSDVTFDDGWYEPNSLPPVARWMGKRGRIRFPAARVSTLAFDLTSHMPDLDTKPLDIEVLLNGQRACALSLIRSGWAELRITDLDSWCDGSNGTCEIEIRANRTWQPRPTQDETRDDRELSIAICNLVVTGQDTEFRRQNSEDRRRE